MSIGEKIAYYRKKAEMSQEELGNQLFVTRQTVSQWENDQTVPTVENFIRLCELFKLTMNDFFEQDVAEAKNTSAEAEERYVFELTKAILIRCYSSCRWDLIADQLCICLGSQCFYGIAFIAACR